MFHLNTHHPADFPVLVHKAPILPNKAENLGSSLILPSIPPPHLPHTPYPKTWAVVVQINPETNHYSISTATTLCSYCQLLQEIPARSPCLHTHPLSVFHITARGSLLKSGSQHLPLLLQTFTPTRQRPRTSACHSRPDTCAPLLPPPGSPFPLDITQTCSSLNIPARSHLQAFEHSKSCDQDSLWTSRTPCYIQPYQLSEMGTASYNLGLNTKSWAW